MSAPSPRKKKRRQRHGRRVINTPASAAGGQIANKVKVLLAVPTVDGNINYTIGIAFAQAVQMSYAPNSPFAFDIHVEPGVRGIEYARNKIIDKFLDATKDDWLYMIDNDQVVPSNFWEVLTVGNADIVSGLTYTWMGGGPQHAMLRVNQYAVNENMECFNLTPPEPAVALGLPYFVPVIGTGCIAIKRAVFEKLGRNVFYFTRHESGRIRGGEDINFSVDASRAGFKIAVHAGVRFGHVKQIDVGQIDAFYRARHGFDNQGQELSPADTLSIS